MLFVVINAGLYSAAVGGSEKDAQIAYLLEDKINIIRCVDEALPSLFSDVSVRLLPIEPSFEVFSTLSDCPHRSCRLV